MIRVNIDKKEETNMFKKFKKEQQDIKNKFNKIYVNEGERKRHTSFGLKSIFVFIVLILFSFIFIGSSINSSIVIVAYISKFIRLFSMILGLFIIYTGVNYLVLQRKLNNKPIFNFAVLLGVTSIAYYIFVTYHTVFEIFYLKW